MKLFKIYFVYMRYILTLICNLLIFININIVEARYTRRDPEHHAEVNLFYSGYCDKHCKVHDNFCKHDKFCEMLYINDMICIYTIVFLFVVLKDHIKDKKKKQE